MYTASGYTGLEIVRTGKLKRLREALGLTPNHMATLLYVSPVTYKAWERQGSTGNHQKMWNSAAEKVARFYETAMFQLGQAKADGFELSQMMPLHLASTELGMPQDLLFRAYREEEIDGLDLGVLGIWIFKDELESFRVAA